MAAKLTRAWPWSEYRCQPSASCRLRALNTQSEDKNLKESCFPAAGLFAPQLGFQERLRGLVGVDVDADRGLGALGECTDEAAFQACTDCAASQPANEGEGAEPGVVGLQRSCGSRRNADEVVR